MRHSPVQQFQMVRTIEHLCSLPLFMGISHSDMNEIISKVRFDFQKYTSGTTVCDIHQINNAIYFLTEGTLEVSRFNENNTILFVERLNSPSIIGAEKLFGISHSFEHRYKAHTDCRFIIIDKKEISSKLLNYEIFRLNFINHLSLLEQRRMRMLHEPLADNLKQRFIQYLRHNFLYPAGQKWIKCKQKDLASALLTNEKKLCALLKEMEKEHLIDNRRTIIDIPAFQNLI